MRAAAVLILGPLTYEEGLRRKTRPTGPDPVARLHLVVLQDAKVNVERLSAVDKKQAAFYIPVRLRDGW